MGTVAHEMGMRLQTYFNKKNQFSFLINDVGSNTLREPLKQIQLQLIMSSLSPGHALSKLNGNTVPPAKFRFSRHLKEFHQTPLHKPDILQLTFASHLTERDECLTFFIYRYIIVLRLTTNIQLAQLRVLNRCIQLSISSSRSRLLSRTVPSRQR